MRHASGCRRAREALSRCYSTSISAGTPLQAVPPPPLDQFRQQYYELSTPVKLVGLGAAWEATECWDRDYMLNTVDVIKVWDRDVGLQYFTPEQFTCGLDEFFDHLDSTDEGAVYLAMNNLEDVSRDLLHHITPPEYCELHPGPPLVNLWVGKQQTSPLHWDIYHNLLTQMCLRESTTAARDCCVSLLVSGSKYVRLYAPGIDGMYPHSDYLSRNVSQIQHAREVDFDRFPQFADVPYWECQIDPGDAVYIPPRWWHHIEALPPAQPTKPYNISVNFWWNKD